MFSESSIPESAPIDAQELIDRCMGNIDLAERVLAKLQSRFNDDLKELEDAIRTNNVKQVATIAHRLKGAASNVAAHDLQRSAAKIEELAREEKLGHLPAHLETMRNQWVRINGFSLANAASD